jgi:beta-glucosidase-like glycosyl hydrolase
LPVLIIELDMGTDGTPIRYGEAIMRAIQSGADMVLLRDPSTLPSSITALTFEAVQAAIKSGRLQQSRIEDAFGRVQQLKAKLRPSKHRIETAELGR